MGFRFGIIIAVFVTVGAALVVSATSSTSSSIMVPSDLVKTAHDVTRIRVGGRVAGHDIDYRVSPDILLSFRVADPGSKGEGATVPVDYPNLKPDMFAPGRDVIIDGDFTGGRIRATNLLTQCPSKYEPPVPGAVKPDTGS